MLFFTSNCIKLPPSLSSIPCKFLLCTINVYCSPATKEVSAAPEAVHRVGSRTSGMMPSYSKVMGLNPV